MSQESRTRVEHDSMGDVEVPAAALWRAQTQRAVDNFPISGRPLDAPLVHALARIKAAAARSNADLDIVTAEQRDAIVAAVAEVTAGDHDDQFPIDVFQTGSGTSTNMNVNEVVSTLTARAGVECHPNDVVNAGQSSNDTFPSAIHVAAVLAAGPLDEAMGVLAAALAARAEDYADAVKSGRTHLMDATPVTLGQELGGYAATAAYARERLAAVLPRVRELPLGGTAVGTGINTPPSFAATTIRHLADDTGEAFVEARNHFEAQGTQDSLVELSGVLKTYAVGLVKICNDLRW
ncbi:MAG: fumarate hydratase, class, partial [Nocardioidaceae bacterium]|nr:fumarate hydratase, class [Nocardioidaceae bacterium]